MGDKVLDGFAEKKIDSDDSDDLGEINEICVDDIEEGSRGR